MEPPTDPSPTAPLSPPRRPLCASFVVSSLSTQPRSRPPASFLRSSASSTPAKNVVERCTGLREPSTQKKPRGLPEKAPAYRREEPSGVSTFSNRPEALEIRFGRLMIGPEDPHDPLEPFLRCARGRRRPGPSLPSSTRRRTRKGDLVLSWFSRECR